MKTIHQYRVLLLVDKHSLDSALEMHSTYQDEIAEQHALANHEAYLKKQALEELEANLFVEFKDASTKVSNDWALAEIKKNRERTELWTKYSAAKVLAAEWEGLLDAWKSRGYNIKTLADLYVAQYFAVTSAGANVGRVGDTTEVLRGKMREASNSVAAGRRRAIAP